MKTMNNWRNRSNNRRPHQNQQNRASFNPIRSQLDSNGPNGRIRGNAQQICEKYQNLAREAAGDIDKVLQESFWQYAEHYQRMVNEYMDKNAPMGDNVNNDTVDYHDDEDQDSETPPRDSASGESGPRDLSQRDLSQRDAPQRDMSSRENPRHQRNHYNQRERDGHRESGRENIRRPNRFEPRNRYDNANDGDQGESGDIQPIRPRKEPIQRDIAQRHYERVDDANESEELPSFLREREKPQRDNDVISATIRRRRRRTTSDEPADDID